MSGIKGQLLCTRDVVRYRRLKTPIATLVDNFFDLLTRADSSGARLRACFAHCLSGDTSTPRGRFVASLGLLQGSLS